MHGRTDIHCRSKKPKRRQGVAAVEFAVCLPVLVLVVLSTIEVTNAIFLRQGLHIAAYEGVKELATPDGALASTNAEIQNILTSRSISSATVTITPSDPALLVRGATVSVQIEAQLTGNSPIRAFVGNRTITVRVVMCHK